MKRAWSIIWKIALVLCVVGLVLLAIGWVTGGLRPLSLNSGHLEIGSTHDQHIDEQSLDAFTTIEIDTDTMAISVVAGDHFGLKVDATNTPRDITWTDQSGTLKLHQQSRVADIQGISERVTAVITVPSDAELTSVSVQSSAAMVTIGADCDTLTVQTTAGVINVSGAVKGDATVTSSAGAITVSGTTGSISASTDAGVVTITGASAAIDVRSTVGAVTVTVPGSWASTNYTLTTTIGSINASGSGAPARIGFGSVQGGPATGYALLLKIETTVGAITASLGS